MPHHNHGVCERSSLLQHHEVLPTLKRGTFLTHTHTNPHAHVQTAEATVWIWLSRCEGAQP